jgi:hypothetical protein
VAGITILRDLLVHRQHDVFDVHFGGKKSDPSYLDYSTRLDGLLASRAFETRLMVARYMPIVEITTQQYIAELEVSMLLFYFKNRIAASRPHKVQGRDAFLNALARRVACHQANIHHITH